MKKINLLWLAVTMLVFGACDKVTEEKVPELSSKTENVYSFSIGEEEIATRTSAVALMTTRIAAGDRIGSFAEYRGVIAGPDVYTISKFENGRFELKENLNFRDPSALHTFYNYFPYTVPAPKSPTMVSAVPVPAVQTQTGESSSHLEKLECYVSSPASTYMGEELNFNFYNVFSSLEFRINTNMDGLIVKSIKLIAPEDKIAAYGSGTLNITKQVNAPGFREVSNIENASNSILLNIDGPSLSIPNSTSKYASAYMTVNPFNAYNEDLTIEVLTNKQDKPYILKVDGNLFVAGIQFSIDLRIEDEDKPIKTIKDIYVLSLCETGSLGEKDNSVKWNTKYGANCDSYNKGFRRVLLEHFGKNKTVETGTIYFDERGHKKCCTSQNLDYNFMTDHELDKYNIIYLTRDARPSAAFAKRIMDWLERSEDRVLMLAYDWKDYNITPTGSTESAILNKCNNSTNYIIFRDHITGVKPHWYNGKTDMSVGNAGSCRSGLLLPFELNSSTSYFWNDGPFKTDLNQFSNQRFWINSKYWGSAVVTDPNVIQLVKYRDARNDCSPSRTHSKGAGDNGMVLGYDPTKRIVYIGCSELFHDDTCVCTKDKKAARIPFNSCGMLQMNNYSKIMANLWAWMIDEVIQNN